MCLQENIRNCSESPSRLSEDGQIKASSTLSELLGIQDCSKSKLQPTEKKKLQKLVTERESFIFEYLLKNRRKILNDKEITWLLSSQDTKSSQTSDQASTGTAKAFSPFWTEHSTAASKKLWLPRKIDSADSPLSSCNGFFADQGLDSLCSNSQIAPLNKNSQTTSYPLSKYFAAAEMEKEGTKLTKMRRVKLNPTKEQKIQLKKFADAARFTYNATVERIEGGEKVNKMALRNALVTHKDNEYFEDKAWLLETPKVIRQQAVFEACKSYKTCFSNLKAQNIKKFKMKFKSKKTKPWTLGIERAIKGEKDKKELAILPQYLGRFRYFGKVPFAEQPEADCSIHKDGCGRYFLQIPISISVKQPSEIDERPVVALDPGIRKFLTGFRSDNTAFMIGQGFAGRLVKLLETIDALDSEMTKVNAQRRKVLRKKKLRLFQKYKDLRDEFHWKVANYLTAEHSLIVLPHLESKPLSQKLRTKTSRELMALSHYTFLQRLKHKCKERNTSLLEATEEFTTKTCGCCGTSVDIRESETFKCTRCDYVADRDINAARNILIKYLRVVSVNPSKFDAYISTSII